MLTIRIVHDILAPAKDREKHEIVLDAPAAAESFKPDEWAAAEVIYVVDGGVVKPSDLVDDGHELVVMHAPGISGVVGFLIQAAISAAVAYFLMPDIPTIEPTGQGTRTYGFTGIANRWGFSTRVPVIFGTHRSGGHVVGFYTETLGSQFGQQVFMLLALSEGPVHEIALRSAPLAQPSAPAEGAVFVEGNDGFRYAGLEITVAQGSSSGGLHAGFMGPRIQRSVGQEAIIAESRLSQAYPGSQAFIKVYDNSAFVAGDTVFLGYNNVTMSSGVTATIDAVDTDGVTIWLDPIFPSQAVAKNQPVVSRRILTVSGDGTTGKAIRLNLNFPSGLYLLDSEGKPVQWTVRLKVEVRTAGVGVWSSLGIQVFSNDRIGSFWQTRSLDLAGVVLQDVDIDIRFTRMTSSPQLSNPNPVYGDQIDIHSIVFVDVGIYKHPGTAILGVHGIPTGQLNGRLPEITSTVKGVKYDKPDDGAGSSFSAVTTANDAHRNPAWQALAILQNRRWGAGAYVLDDDIDFQSFIDWADYCDEVVLSGFAQTTLVDPEIAGVARVLVPQGAGAAFTPGDEITIGYETSNAETLVVDSVIAGAPGNGATLPTQYTEDYDEIFVVGTTANPHDYGEIIGVTEVRCMSDHVFDEDMALQDALSRIAACGRAIIVKTGQRWRAVVDRPAIPTQLFSEANVIAGTWSHTTHGIVNSPNVMEVAYLEADDQYERRVAKVPDSDGLADGEPLRVDRVDLFGVTRIGQAYRDAAFYLRKKRMLRTRIEFHASLYAIACEAGDLIEVSHRALTNGRGTKIIDSSVASGVTRIKLDERIDTTLGGYNGAAGFMVRLADPTDDEGILEAVITNPGGPRGEWLILDQDIGGVGSAFAGWIAAYGIIDETTQLVTIQRIDTADDLGRKIIATIYDERVFEERVPQPLPTPGTGSGLHKTELLLPEKTEISDWATTGGSGDYGSGESNLTGRTFPAQGVNGEPRLGVALSWNPPTRDAAFGDDFIPRTYRTPGTFTPATLTLAGDGVASDLATEGGGVREPVALLRGYAVFMRHPDATTEDQGWIELQFVTEPAAWIDFPFPAGDFDFKVVPEMMSGQRYPFDECPSITLSVPDGFAHPDLALIATPPAPTVRMRPRYDDHPAGWVDFSAAERADIAGRVPNFIEVRVGISWITGRVLARGKGGEFDADIMAPDSALEVLARGRTQAGLWSSAAGSATLAWVGPWGMDEILDHLEGATSAWGGTKTDCTIDGDGRLAIDSGKTSAVYISGLRDTGGVPGGTDRHLAWIEISAGTNDGTLYSDTGVSWGDPQITFEGDLGDDGAVVIKVEVGATDNGGAKVSELDFTEVDGVLELTERYYALRVTFDRDLTTRELWLEEARLVVYGPEAGGGGR